MRVLHLIPLHIPAGGIVRQAIAEQHAAEDANLDWTVRLFTDIELPAEAEGLRVHAHRTRESDGSSQNWVRYATEKLRHRQALYRWMRRHHGDYDVMLLRYTTSDIARSHTLRTISTPVVSVHHTLEMPEIAMEAGYQRWIRLATEKFAGRRNLRAATAIAGVTQEIVDYELSRVRSDLPNFVFPNGIDVKKSIIAEDARGEVPEILFVASTFAPWHGLDRLIADLLTSDENFVLHLVGEVNHADAKLVDKDPRVQLHGRLDHEAIAPLVARSWVGLSSFALDRKGMNEACTLKVREYLAAGLPTYAGHQDRFPGDAIYYRQGPPRVVQILNYARKVRGLARRDIRDASALEIDKANILKEAHDELQRLLGPL